jgi:hypothetical protein
MKLARSTAIAATLVALAGCDGIGPGSTVQKLRLFVSPVGSLDQGALVDKGLATEHFRMFDCFCSNLAAVATFTDGTQSIYNSRATWRSDDTDVVEVLNDGETTTLCPITQRGAGLLIPKSVGVARVTADFLGLKDTFEVRVIDTEVEAGGTLVLAPTDTTNTGELGVGTSLALQVKVTLDNKPRVINGNVTTWQFTDEVEANTDPIAKIDPFSGVVRGFGVGNLTAKAVFATCSAAHPGLQPTHAIAVGELVPLPEPLTVDEEAGFDTSADDLLAANSNELLKIMTGLDFDNDNVADATQDIGTQSKLTWTESCTKRTFLLGGDGSSTLTDCAEATTTCANTVPICASSQDACVTGKECRLVATPMIAVANRVTALRDANDPTTFTALFPGVSGPATTLAAAATVGGTSLTIASLSGYPSDPPWDAIIDQGGTAEETVRVKDFDFRTRVLTLDKPLAQDHASGESFNLRFFSSSNTVSLQADGRKLASLDASAPDGTSVPAFGTLQLHATGTFADQDATDPVEADRTQRVTRLSGVAGGSPTVRWFSSDLTVAVVSNGLVTAANACGGTATIRTRANTSGNSTTGSFDRDSTADDDACTGTGGTDPLCDQIEISVAQANPLPEGTTCDP